MKVTDEMVENKIAKYIEDTGNIPRYVLMDEGSHEHFAAAFKPEKLAGATIDKTEEPSKFKDLSLYSNFVENAVGILSVKTEKDLFEVVS